MGLQAIGRWHRIYPSVIFDYVVSEECQSLVEGHPLIRKAWVIPRQTMRRSWTQGEAPAALRLLEDFVARLEESKYDVSLNLFQEKSGALIQGFVSAARKAGMELGSNGVLGVASRMLEHLFAIPAARADNGWHAVDVFIRAGCAELGPPEPRGEARHQPGNTFQRGGGLPPLSPPQNWPSAAPTDYVVLHPGSAWPGKRWPETHWSRLVIRLSEVGKKVVLTGSPEERAVGDRILEGMGTQVRGMALDMIGKTDLPGLAWVIEHARQAISGDTVAMHLAAIQGIPTLCLFGASNPVETGPYGTGHFILQTEPGPLPDLDLQNSHPGLERLSADVVADFLLLGRLPATAQVWETAWSPRRDMQVLRDAQGRMHPSQSPSKRLMPVLDEDQYAPSALSTSSALSASPSLPGENPSPIPNAYPISISRHAPPSALRVWQALRNAQTLPSKENITALERVEQELGLETPDDLVWDAYRIGINSLPLDNLEFHLESRMRRLSLALSEIGRTQPPN